MGSLFESVVVKLEGLRDLDPGLHVFGATRHQHRLAPPASEAELGSVESLLGVRLPDEYREFLTEVGNGGVGPGYGLDRVTLVTGSARSRVRRGELTVVPPDPERWQLSPRYLDDRGDEVDRFDVEFFSLADDLQEPEIVKRLRGRFRLKPIYEPPAPGEWKAVPGLLPMNNYGCGIFAGLVLKGAHRGEVWIGEPNYGVTTPFALWTTLHEPHIEPRDGWQPIEARPFGFADWYTHWLDRALDDPDLPSTPR